MIQGVTRILTSGQRESAPAGSHVLRELLQRSQRSGGPDILPGAGINPGTIRHILDQLLPHGLKEVHLSGGKWVDGGMLYRPGGMGMGASTEAEWKVWMTDGDVIRAHSVQRSRFLLPLAHLWLLDECWMFTIVRLVFPRLMFDVFAFRLRAISEVENDPSCIMHHNGR